MRHKRGAIITFIALVNIIGGIVSILISIPLAIQNFIYDRALRSEGEVGSLVSFLVPLLFGVTSLIDGIGLWRLHKWAWYIMLIFIVLVMNFPVRHLLTFPDGTSSIPYILLLSFEGLLVHGLYVQRKSFH